MRLCSARAEVAGTRGRGEGLGKGQMACVERSATARRATLETRCAGLASALFHRPTAEENHAGRVRCSPLALRLPPQNLRAAEKVEPWTRYRKEPNI